MEQNKVLFWLFHTQIQSSAFLHTLHAISFQHHPNLDLCRFSYRWNLPWERAHGRIFCALSVSTGNWKFPILLFSVSHSIDEPFLIRTDCISIRVVSNSSEFASVPCFRAVKHELTRNLIKSDQRQQISLAELLSSSRDYFLSFFYCSFSVWSWELLQNLLNRMEENEQKERPEGKCGVRKQI